MDLAALRKKQKRQRKKQRKLEKAAALSKPIQLNAPTNGSSPTKESAKQAEEPQLCIETNNTAVNGQDKSTEDSAARHASGVVPRDEFSPQLEVGTAREQIAPFQEPIDPLSDRQSDDAEVSAEGDSPAIQASPVAGFELTDERTAKMKKAISKYLKKHDVTESNFATSIHMRPVSEHDFYTFGKRFFASLSKKEFEILTEHVTLGQALSRSTGAPRTPSLSKRRIGDNSESISNKRQKRATTGSANAHVDTNSAQAGDVFIRGPFSEAERSTIASAVDEYRSEHDLTEMEFRNLVWDEGSEKKKKQDFYAHFIHLLRQRKPRTVRDFLRRAYMPCNRLPFTKEDDEEIIRLHRQLGSDWKAIGNTMGRYQNDVRDRYRNHLEHAATFQGEWSTDETEKFMKIIETYASREEMNWSTIAKQMGTRSRPQCRDKYLRMNGERSYTPKKTARLDFGGRDKGEVLPGDKLHMLQLIRESDAENMEEVLQKKVLAPYEGVFESKRLHRKLRVLLEPIEADSFRDKVAKAIRQYEAQDTRDWQRTLIEDANA